MDTLLVAAGGILVLCLLAVGYIKLSDPTDVDMEEEEILRDETPDERTEEETHRHHKTIEETEREEVDFYSHQ